MKRIGMTTGGGDAPGLNAVIRAVVKTAWLEVGAEVIGIEDGFDGLLREGGTYTLTVEDVRGIHVRGGTILGAANRGNPFARRVERDGQIVTEDISELVLQRLDDLKLDALILVGGDGTLQIGRELLRRGYPIIAVPKTIDNDINGTETTFGFDTALNTATDAIDKLHTTAEAHHRVMVLELMGRHAGFIALHAGVAGGADVILIPEIPFRFDSIHETVLARASRRRKFSIVAVAEGAYPQGGQESYIRHGDDTNQARLGGIGQMVSDYVARECKMETRVTVLGHLQRGGRPTPFDRWLATRYGAAAVRLASRQAFGRMVALRFGEVVDISIEEALAVPKRVDVNGDGVRTARGLGICMGD